MEILFFSLALAVLGTAAFFAWKNRFDTKQCIASITLGVFFATFFMVLPTGWVKEGKEVFCEPLYAGLSSLLYSLKALGGRQDIGQLESMALPGVLKAVYIGLGYLCFTLAPILASSLILTFVGDTGEKLRFWLKKSPKCYVFSEINENALAIAKGIQTKTGKKALVFCNGKSADKSLVVKAKKAGGIVLHKPCDALAVTGRFDTYEFFLISADEDSNIRLAETLIAKHSDNRKASILVNAFAESGTNVTLLENILKAKDTRIELRCIDEIAMFCNHLVYKHPLYNTESDTVSVAIVGCGRLGMRMLKTVYWAGQIAGRTLKIRVYDKDDCRNAFYGDCPGLEGSEVIQFVKADVGSASFREQLLEHSGDATYIVVAMGSDQLNLSVAENLYRIYRRHFDFRDDRMPEIFTRIRSQAKCDNYSANPEFLQKRHIHLFGTTAELYSEQTLFNTELENLAFAVHLTYNGQMPPDKSSEDYAKSIKEFKTGEYGRRSSMAAALHLSAKLSVCDKISRTGETIFTAKNLQVYAQELKDDSQFLQRLVRNEHDRWNAFMLTEGYLPATEDQMHRYAAAVDSHKDDLSMTHPCITGWDALDKLEAQYNRTYGKEKTFKKYDIDIVEKLPLIWEVAQGL